MNVDPGLHERKAIWKYNLDTNFSCEFFIPKDSKFLHFGTQGTKDMCLWMLVNPDQKTVERRCFEVYGTGHDIFNWKKLEYRGTTLILDGALVLHLFERSELEGVEHEKRD